MSTTFTTDKNENGNTEELMQGVSFIKAYAEGQNLNARARLHTILHDNAFYWRFSKITTRAKRKTHPRHHVHPFICAIIAPEITPTHSSCYLHVSLQIMWYKNRALSWTEHAVLQSSIQRNMTDSEPVVWVHSLTNVPILHKYPHSLSLLAPSLSCRYLTQGRTHAPARLQSHEARLQVCG